MNENDLMHFEEIQSVIGLNLQTDTIIFKEKNEFLDLIFSLLKISHTKLIEISQPNLSFCQKLFDNFDIIKKDSFYSTSSVKLEIKTPSNFKNIFENEKKILEEKLNFSDDFIKNIKSEFKSEKTNNDNKKNNPNRSTKNLRFNNIRSMENRKKEKKNKTNEFKINENTNTNLNTDNYEVITIVDNNRSYEKKNNYYKKNNSIYYGEDNGYKNKKNSKRNGYENTGNFSKYKKNY